MIARGQIYWCTLDPVQGHEQGSVRPVVVVSADAYNKTQSPLVAVVPLTKVPPKTPLHLSFAAAETGLDLPSTVLVDHARFVDRSRLRGEAAGHLNAEALSRLDRQLRRVLSLG